MHYCVWILRLKNALPLICCLVLFSKSIVSADGEISLTWRTVLLSFTSFLYQCQKHKKMLELHALKYFAVVGAYFQMVVSCFVRLIAVTTLMSINSNNGYKGYERAFCIRMKSTLTKRGCHFKSSGYRVSRNKKSPSPPTKRNALCHFNLMLCPHSIKVTCLFYVGMWFWLAGGSCFVPTQSAIQHGPCAKRHIASATSGHSWNGGTGHCLAATQCPWNQVGSGYVRNENQLRLQNRPLWTKVSLFN